MTDPHGTPIWYELVTADPDAAARFYGAVVGWHVGTPAMPGMDYRIIETEDGAPGTQAGGVMRLTDEMAAGGMTPGWLLYLGVDDVDAAAGRVAAAGGSVVREPWDLDGVGRMALVADPGGVAFYVMRGASEEDSGAFSPVAKGRCAWNELATADQPGAVAFYRDQFGWSQEGAMPMGEMGDYLFVQKGDVPLGAIMRSRPDHPDGWNFTFRVPDAHAAADRIRAAGGTVLHGPVEVPGDMLVVQALDPEGLMFGVCAGPDAQ